MLCLEIVGHLSFCSLESVLKGVCDSQKTVFFWFNSVQIMYNVRCDYVRCGRVETTSM